MLEMNYFRSIQGAQGCTSEKDVRVAAFRRRFGRDFDSSIHVVYNAIRNGVTQDFIVTPTSAGCDLIARPGENFQIGDIIFYNGLHWLVTDVNFHDDLTCSGEMVRCNRQIRWQNPQTREIIERWCLVTKPYTSNVNTGVSVTTSNREFKVQVPFDTETKLVDIDKRFMLEVINGKPRTYSCISVDQQTNKYEDIDGGFIVWNLEQDAAGRQNDNVELMICDYIAPEEGDPSPVDPTLLPCSISGRDTIRAGVGERAYTAAFYLEDGATVDESVEAVWSVVVPDGCESYVSWTTEGNILKLSALEKAVGQTIGLRVADHEGQYQTAGLEVEVVESYG